MYVVFAQLKLPLHLNTQNTHNTHKTLRALIFNHKKMGASRMVYTQNRKASKGCSKRPQSGPWLLFAKFELSAAIFCLTTQGFFDHNLKDTCLSPGSFLIEGTYFFYCSLKIDCVLLENILSLNFRSLMHS